MTEPEHDQIARCNWFNLVRAGGDQSPLGQFSLVGVFHSLRFSTFPALAPRFTAYVALYDGFGEGKMQLVITSAKTDEDIYVYQRWLSFPKRLGLVNLEIKIRRCMFPYPGRYWISLRFDNEETAVRSINVFDK